MAASTESGLPDFSLGFLYGPAFAGLAIGALSARRAACCASHHIPDVLIHRMFIGYLGLILFVMIVWGS